MCPEAGHGAQLIGSVASVLEALGLILALYFLEMGFLCGTVAVLGLTLKTRLTSNS